MKCEIITIGDEILLGKTIDTNSAWIAQELLKLGLDVLHKSSISDKEHSILNALKEASVKSDLVIVTGGLGPTNDDITKSCIAHYFETNIEKDEQVYQRLSQRWKQMGRVLDYVNEQQANLPKSAKVLPNDWGTASGLWLERDKTIFVFFPGVPREMKNIFSSYFVPEIKQRLSDVYFKFEDIFTVGLPEAKIAHLIQDVENELPKGIGLAFLPSLGRVTIRLYIRKKYQNEVIEKIKTDIKNCLSYAVIGDGNVPLELWIQSKFNSEGKWLGIAESCTGGLLSHMISKYPGSSSFFKGTIVSYSNEIKNSILQVPKDTIDGYGAVSKQTVKKMLKGALSQLAVDYAIAITGIAGPSGGTLEKPVGQIWIAVGDKNREVVKCLNLKGDRMQNMETSSTVALNQLRKFILEIP